VVAYRVLGPTEVESGGSRVELGGPVLRRLVAALILADGQLVSYERLAEAVWGAEGPKRGAAALHVSVSRLRRALGDRDRVALEREGPGYRLLLPAESTDVTRFCRDVDHGRQLLARGRADAAVQTLTDALALWRGEPYADLPASHTVDGARARLVELREMAIDERSAARLAAGDAAGAVLELDGVVGASPHRERRWELLVLGLYRSGRPAEALAALRRVREQLAADLGAEPGAELRELERRILAQDPELSAPAPAAPTPTGRGRPLSSFLGRATELSTVAAALRDQRLVTVVGPAGVGKTRLAVEYLAQASGADGQWLARLADVRHPEGVGRAVIEAVGATPVDGDPCAAVRAALVARPGVLVLDNCEHLVDAAAELVLTLLECCPELRVLATSREPLGVDGETVLGLGPLPIVTGDGADGPAVDLLLSRVRSARPDWSPSAEEKISAREICTALDGLPLALELAAARARAMGLGGIAKRLDDRFAVLGPVPRGSLTPHATLSAAIGWSVEQLDEADRALLTRLWPFEGGFGVEAAEAVCPGHASTFESLSSLVARSVVVVDTETNPTRYRLLETLRAYCREHDPDPSASLEAHARWCRELVARCSAELPTRGGRHGMRSLRGELPNLRACIDHDLANHPAEALRTMGLLDWFWVRGAHFAEARQLLDAALDAAPDSPAVDRARGYVSRANLSLFLDEDPDQIDRLFAESVAVASEVAGSEDPEVYPRVLFLAACGWNSVQRPDKARGAAERAIELSQAHGLDWLVACGKAALGGALVLQGHTAEGQATLAEATDLAEECGSSWATAWSHLTLGQALLRQVPNSAQPRWSARAALDALRPALKWFEHNLDQTYSLAALEAGAVALALTGHAAESARLHTAVRRHSQRLGMPPGYLPRLGRVMGEPPPAPPLDLTQQTKAESEAAAMSWSHMVDLVAEAPAGRAQPRTPG